MTVALVLSASASLIAQDLKHALTRMQQLYAQSDRLHIVMRIQAFENETSSTPYYHEKADIKRSGTHYHYQFGATDMLLNDRFLVMVDKAAREITYRKQNSRRDAALPSAQSLNMDSLFRFYENPQYLGRKGNTDHYRAVQKKGPVDRIDLLIRADTGFLAAVKYRYRKGPLVSIDFLKFDPRPHFGPEVFDENKYVTTEAGKFKAAAPFRNYHVSQSQTP
jgi:hypothetical protein